MARTDRQSLRQSIYALRARTLARLGELLRDMSKAKGELLAGISQSDAARQSGVSFATINRLCTNVTRQVHLDVLEQLAKLLKVEPGDLARAGAERTKEVEPLHIAPQWTNHAKNLSSLGIQPYHPCGSTDNAVRVPYGDDNGRGQAAHKCDPIPHLEICAGSNPRTSGSR
ncbi:MAG: helix-turn-helix transcriptional regulator [Gemmatimonadaceae bacterium]|nr:helix-turn-helix transcriptional regulator [Gemmatimonadaceae bacterium]MBA3559657.1 helix-turn-helix transcriptional regulator [Gemmatimonadaceae bacterium]